MVWSISEMLKRTSGSLSKRLLAETLAVQSVSGNTAEMTEYIVRKAEEFGAHSIMVEDGNIYITKGHASIYPCIVAHTDTVHKIIPGYRVWESKYGDFFAWDHEHNTPAGVGGDDKVGIYIALALLREKSAIKLAFFRDEEIGCKGAREADMTFFDDVSFALQADRRGYDDIVVRASAVDLASDEFTDRVEAIGKGYKKKLCRTGSMTDVQQLKKDGLKVSAINASCGYYSPHGPHEYVVIEEVMLTKKFFREIVDEMGGERWTHEYVPPVVKTYKSSYTPKSGKAVQPSLPGADAGKRGSRVWGYDDDDYWADVWKDEWPPYDDALGGELAEFYDPYRPLYDPERLLDTAPETILAEFEDMPTLTTGLSGDNYDIAFPDVVTSEGRIVNEWETNRHERMLIERYADPADITYATCWDCLQTGSLVIWVDNGLMSGEVICNHCEGEGKPILIGEQDRIGGYFWKDRSILDIDSIPLHNLSLPNGVAALVAYKKREELEKGKLTG